MSTVRVRALARDYDPIDVAARMPAGKTVTAYGFDAATGEFVVEVTPDLTGPEATTLIRYLTTIDADDEARVAAMDDTLAELDNFAAGSGTLTTTQLTPIIRRMARVLAALIRYVRRRA